MAERTLSGNVYSVFRTISYTPLRDIIRGRVTGRLDWRRRVAGAGLPAVAADLIVRVVTRTRLLRLEKAAVADELLAHFLDGTAAGATAVELVERFGNPATAARLIRRAKQRARPFPWHPWHLWRLVLRVTAVVIVVYGLMLLRFCLTHPSPTVDYLAELNKPIEQTPPADRAWPQWRQAIIACGTMDKHGVLQFTPPNDSPWPGKVEWLEQHKAGIAMARQAAAKPALGFVLGPRGSLDDPQLPFAQFKDAPDAPLYVVLHPRENGYYMSRMFLALSFDARRAAEAGDAATVEADIMAMLGLARQLQYSDGLVDDQMMGVSIRYWTIERIQRILMNTPNSLPDDALIRLAHAISGPEVAGDLVSLKQERMYFLDAVQRLYTDDGHGDGHATLDGWRTLDKTIALMPGNRVETNLLKYPAGHIDGGTELASSVPMLTASRADVVAMYDRLMDQQEGNLHLPVRQVDLNRVRSELNTLSASPVDRMRYGFLIETMPIISWTQTETERYLGLRDGTGVGIALELFRRRHGTYPTRLDELVTEFLPSVPADRITGEPVKYRLADGKPIVYSVGADRIDDGGTPPPEDSSGTKAASWGGDSVYPAKGDWLLFAPQLIEGIQ